MYLNKFFLIDLFEIFGFTKKTKIIIKKGPFFMNIVKFKY